MFLVTKGYQVFLEKLGWSVLGPWPAIGLSVLQPGKAELGMHSGASEVCGKEVDKEVGDYSSGIDRNWEACIL